MDTKARIKKIIMDMKQAPELDESIELINSGFLDSFDVINLVSLLETQFHIKIAADLIVPENLETLQAMTDLVNKLSQK